MSAIVEPILPPEGMTAAPRRPLLALVCAAAGGIVLDAYGPQSFERWWLAAAGAVGLWLLLLAARRPTLALLALLAAYALAFASWHHARWHLFAADEIATRAALELRPVCVEATALESVRWRPAPQADPLRVIPAGDTCRLRVAVTAIRDGDDWTPVTGRALLTIDGHLVGVGGGDRLRILALVHRTPPAQNPGEYDPAQHERVDRQLVRLDAPSPDCVKVMSFGAPLAPRRLVSQLRDRCHEQLWQRIHPQRAGLAAGLLVGSREQIEYEQTQQFFLTGTIHLLAISGVHVGILATGFWLVMRTGVLGRRSAILAAIAFVTLYTLLAGAEPPIVRSAMLVGILCLGRWLGRPTPALNSLAAGGLVVLALNPCELFEVGTQLSFLAVATLIACSPLLAPQPPADPLARLIAESRPWPWRYARACGSYFLRLWLTGVCIWLLALPLTLYRFHVLSPSGLVLNVVLWLPITLALYAGFAALTVGWIVPPLGLVCGKLCDGCLWLVATCVEAGEAAPLSHSWHPGPALWWVLGFYAAVALYAVWPRCRPTRLWSAAIVVAWVAIGYATSERSPLNVRSERHEQLRCTFVAVGHDTSCLVEFPGGETLLYDAGHMGTPAAGARSISAVLWSRGIRHLDAIVISHADADHYNCVPELLSRFDVGCIYVSPVMFHRQPAGVRVLRAAIERSGVPLKTLHGGQRLELSAGAACEALHPPQRGVLGTDNANSIVLAVEYAGQRLLLPGDLERNGLDDLLAEEPLAADVVMAPHHGSASSNPRGFAEWSTPRWVVISGARNRDATEVIDAYRSYGAEVLHTAHDGAIAFTLCRDGQLHVAHWQDNAWQPRYHRGE